MVVAIECCHLATQKRVKEKNSKMGIRVDTSKSEFPVLPLGTYEVSLNGLEEKEGVYGEQLLWKFETAEETYDVNDEPVEPGLSVWEYSPIRFTDYPSKAWKIAQALLGSDGNPASLLVDTGKVDENGEAVFNLDLDRLIGRHCRLELQVSEYVNKEGQTVTRNKVIKNGVKASKKYAGQVSEAVTAPVEDDSIPF